MAMDRSEVVCDAAVVERCQAAMHEYQKPASATQIMIEFPASQSVW
jgi:hypothetical protein